MGAIKNKRNDNCGNCGIAQNPDNSRQKVEKRKGFYKNCIACEKFIAPKNVDKPRKKYTNDWRTNMNKPRLDGNYLYA